MVTLGFLAAVIAAAAGLVAVVRLASGRSAVPRIRLSTRLDSSRVRQAGLAVAAGLVALLLTRWPLAGIAAAAIVLLWPRIAGGGRTGRRQLETLEAIVAWTESLRDTASAAAGLEQAIPAAAEAAQPLLRAPVRELAARLEGRVPLPEALTRFAEDLHDPAADLVGQDRHRTPPVTSSPPAWLRCRRRSVAGSPSPRRP